MVYSVWLFVRPLSYTMLLSPLTMTSERKVQCCHWGILVSEMSLLDTKAILSRSVEYGGHDGTNIGVLYELFRDRTDEHYTFKTVRPFRIATLKNEWRILSFQYIGQTSMTHRMIEMEAVRIMDKRPTYRLFGNNCPNFIKFLLEVICPDGEVPDTIQDTIQRMNDMLWKLPKRNTSLPSACPSSDVSTDVHSFKGASGTSWSTASDKTWMTAIQAKHSSSISYQNNDVSRSRTILIDTEFNRQSSTITPLTMEIGLDALAKAVVDGDEEMAASLLNAGLSPSSTILDQEDMLDVAVKQNDVLRVYLLLRAGVKITTSAVINAMEKQHDRVLKMLYDVDPDFVLTFFTKSHVSHQNPVGKIPLHLAASEGRTELVRILLDAESNPSTRDVYLQTPLHSAASGGSLKIIKMLLEAGSKICVEDEDWETPLHVAASRRHTAAVKFLLDAGSNISAQDKNGSTPLHVAAFAGSTEIVRVLLDAGSDVSVLDRFGRNALHSAVHNCNDLKISEIVRKLLNAGSGVAYRDMYGATTLHTAASRGFLEVVSMLLGLSRSEISVRDVAGRTPLLSAIANCNKTDILPKLVRMLLDGESDTSLQDSQGSTALHIAASRGLLNVVTILLTSGSLELSVRDSVKRTPLLCAVANCQKSLEMPKLIKILLNAGSDVSLPDEHGATALHMAVAKSSPEIVKMLLDKGRLEISALNDAGRTPLHIAAISCNELNMAEVIEMLLKEGADPNTKEHSGRTAFELLLRRNLPHEVLQALWRKMPRLMFAGMIKD